MAIVSTESPLAEEPEFGYLQSDEPIVRRAEDRLDRARLAEEIAQQAIDSPPGQGFVIAIDGPWGSGKTSVMNMIEEAVAEGSNAVVLRFNPWLFSDTEQLVVRFMHELAAQLGEKASSAGDERLSLRLRDISERLGSYGDVLVPLGWVPLVGAVALACWSRRQGCKREAEGEGAAECPCSAEWGSRGTCCSRSAGGRLPG